MSAQASQSEFVKPSYLADRFGVHVTHVTALLRRGLIPEALQTSGGHWRIPREAADRATLLHKPETRRSVAPPAIDRPQRSDLDAA